MHIVCVDTNAVPSTTTEMFRVLQPGLVKMAIVLKNTGLNNITYQFEESSNGTTWALITGSDGTLIPSGNSQVAFHAISSAMALVRLVASGDSTIEFSMTRYFVRSSGGAIPILTV